MVDWRHLTQLQAAFLLGVTSRAFRDWNAPRNSDGTYDGPAVVAWRLETLGQSGALDLNAERARLAKWQADKTHQEVELRAGRMLLDDDVRAWVAGMIATAKQRLVQIPETVRQLVHHDHADRVATDVRRLINEALAELSAYREDDSRANVAALGATADADSEPVGRPVPQAIKRKRRRAGAVAD